MTGEPMDRIRGEIRADGPITFARFMELALYGPGGFYEDPPVGAGGDFVTSPHVHPVFGELLGRTIRSFHEALGRPAPFRVQEAGAGDGTLAMQMLEALGDLPVAYRAVDISPGARDALAVLPGVTVGETIEDSFHVVIANELLDNLPFRVLQGGREVRIGLDADGDLVEVGQEPDPDLAPLARRGVAVAPTGALAFVDLVAGALTNAPGYALLIDYGTGGGGGGGVHGYRDHTLVEDVLDRPGTSDITAGVDFALLAEHAARRGAVAFPSVTQRAALIALGFEDWFHEQLATQHAALDARDGMTAVRTWSGKSRASLLADPGGLGRFRWLVLASPGLPQPDWLQRALSAEGPS